MRYVTRADVHIDRVATAWAIRRFVDPHATFLFVDRKDDVRQIDAIPFDMRGVELGHHFGRCSFEALIDKHELREPAILLMGRIIRAIDMPLDEPPPETYAWVRSAFDELRASGLSDEDRIIRGGAICDELYRACVESTRHHSS